MRKLTKQLISILLICIFTASLLASCHGRPRNKTIGEVYFWNYTEATIVAIKDGKDGTLQVSPGPDFPLRDGDTLIIVGKDKYSFDRVLNFITYGVEDE